LGFHEVTAAALQVNSKYRILKSKATGDGAKQVLP
jgi:hypothetical protein